MNNCFAVVLKWAPNATPWETYPAFGPTWYEIDLDSTPAATITADYPNDVTWDSGDMIPDGEIFQYDIFGLFSGPLKSAPLTKHLRCTTGVLDVLTDTPTPTPE
jgi:hypothetical protein